VNSRHAERTGGGNISAVVVDEDARLGLEAVSFEETVENLHIRLHETFLARNNNAVEKIEKFIVGSRQGKFLTREIRDPWNKFAEVAAEPDFRVRHRLDSPDLVELFSWSEAEYLAKTEGSALRRLGFGRWLRNLAVALGNAPRSPAAAEALAARAGDADPVVREHVAWALERQVPGG
jgi:hypothetical protein